MFQKVQRRIYRKLEQIIEYEGVLASNFLHADVIVLSLRQLAQSCGVTRGCYLDYMTLSLRARQHLNMPTLKMEP